MCLWIPEIPQTRHCMQYFITDRHRQTYYRVVDCDDGMVVSMRVLICERGEQVLTMNVLECGVRASSYEHTHTHTKSNALI